SRSVQLLLASPAGAGAHQLHDDRAGVSPIWLSPPLHWSEMDAVSLLQPCSSSCDANAGWEKKSVSARAATASTAAVSLRQRARRSWGDICGPSAPIVP